MTKEVGEYLGVAAPVSTQYPQYIRDNYTVWATTMEWALESNEIWEAIDPGGDEFKKGASKYRKDRHALTAICSVMPMDVKQHLISKTSAKEAWETIKTLNLGHARVREAALQTLQKKYENLEMGEDETLDAFASRVATLVNGIRALDEKLEEISIVRRFLRAVPPRYLSVVSAIEQCVDLKTLTMDDLVGRFKAHDERMKITYGDTVPEEHVMLTRAQWQAVVAKEKGDKAYDNRSDKEASFPARKYIAGEDEDDAPPRRKFDIKKVRCHNCGELGHFKVDCRKPPKPKERALIAQEGDDGPMMLMLEVCEQKDEEELPPPSPATEIVMDHGLLCVDHVEKLCDEGVVEKQRSSPFSRETTDQASEALELVHGDICGPISPATPSGNEYFMLVVDDISQYMWIVLLKSKDLGLQAFEKIKEAGEIEAREKRKSLRIDRGGKLKHTVVAMARSMMESKGLPGKFWGEAVNTAVYLLNRAPTRSMVGGTPYEAWYGRKPSVDHLSTFGCVAHVKTVSSHKRNLEDRSTPMIMTGYEKGSKAYRLCNPSTNKVIVTCDVVFEEDLSWIWNSTEPDDTFTVVHSEVEHADDQPGKDMDESSGTSSSSTSEPYDADAEAENLGRRFACPAGATLGDASLVPCSPGSGLAWLPGSHAWAGALQGSICSSAGGVRAGSPSRLGGPDGALPGGLDAQPSNSGGQVRPGEALPPGHSPERVLGREPEASVESHALPGATSPEETTNGQASCPASRSERSRLCAALIESKESNGSADLGGGRPVQAALVPLEADIPVRRHTRYMCLELMELAMHELACTGVHYSQNHRQESHPSGKELAMHVPLNLGEEVLRRDYKGESRRSDVGPQLASEGSASEETSATSGAEEYVVLSLLTLETRRLRPTRARMRRVLNYYSKKELRTVNNPVKMKHTKQCLFIKEPVKTEDADKDCQREAQEKPAKVKSVTWVPRGTAKAMPMKTPARNSWRIWDPGGSEAHVVLRG
ncbi:hypothetical protein QYE76_058279 [Lolium multiflorum]|uniref:CCHC-type domain-containing protein n=1 Tax=Lolium multiflorum TaxID=4521 RepID=A0AAD8WSB5_LOLMU|nr:hypothetical protein QYE76_058279 [Lolium multiflorum]